MPQFALSGPHTGVEARLQAIAADTSVLDAPPEDAEEFPPPSPLAQQHTDVKLAARVQTLANAGSIERAAAALDPQTIAEPTSATKARLEALHPHEPPPHVPLVDTAPAQCDEQMFAEVVRNLKKGKAPGELSGTYEMLQAAAFGSAAGLQKCCAFVNAMLAFDMPRVPALVNCKGVAFDKNGPSAVRPIAIAEAWLRLAAIVCLRKEPDIGTDLAEAGQLGVGIPGGADNIGHAINAALATDPSNTLVVSFDWANAFNTPSRTALFAEVAATYPSLLPFVNLVYDAHTTVRFFAHHPSGPIDVTSASGVRQGDPLGSALFSLMGKRTLQAVKTAHPRVHPIAYTDDTYLIGPPDDMTGAFHTLIQAGANIRLQPSLHKCHVYGTPGTAAFNAARTVAQTLNIPHAQQGFIAAGTPIGPPAYVTQHVSAKADDVIATVTKLMSLSPPLTAQTKFLLLSRSLQRRLTHFSRVCSPDTIRAPLSKLQAAVEDAAFHLFQIPQDPRAAAAMGLPHALVRQQLRLPLREGGFDLNAAGGCPHPTPHARNLNFSLSINSLTSSYLSSAARCHEALEASPACLRPLSHLQYTGEPLYHAPIPSATRLPSLWRHLAIETRGVDDPSYRLHPAQLQLCPTTIARDIQALHPQVTAALTSMRASTLFHAADQPAHHARMHSLRCRHAGAYLDTIPVSPYLRLSDADFISGSQFRLGATGTNPSIPATTCYCGQHVQGSDIDHAMTCPKLSGSRSRRHDDWKDALSRVTARAGYSNRVEPGYNEVGTAAPGRAGSRADIEARLPPPHGPALLDVSLTHPRAATYVTDAATIQGSAAAKRDALKYRGHNGHYHPGYTFIPASVETYGYLGKPLVRYLNTLSGVAAARGPAVTKGSFLAGAHRELSVALIKCQESVYRGCANLLARAAGRPVLPGAEVPYVD